jgi:hypothetical protein
MKEPTIKVVIGLLLHSLFGFLIKKFMQMAVTSLQGILKAIKIANLYKAITAHH